MKDFQEIINGPQQVAPLLKTTPEEVLPYYRQVIDQSLPYISPFLLSIITGPISTTAILLQMTSKGVPSPMIAKINAQPHLQRHILNGIFGDNRLYQPPTIGGYKQALKRLGRQGLRGFYKGNFTGVILASSNAWIRGKLYSRLGQTGVLKEGIQANLLTIALCTITDLVTLPLMTAQSRLVLQNSSPNFRTYQSAFSVWKSAPKFIFSGGSIILLKNILFELSWVKLLPASPANSFILSTLISHLLTYPFFTVMRNMQVSDPKAPMMYNRVQRVRDTIQRLWTQGGVKSIYRGFLGHSCVHLFTGALMIQANLRSGFFIE